MRSGKRRFGRSCCGGWQRFWHESRCLSRSPALHTNHLDKAPEPMFDEVVASMFNSKKYMVSSTLIMNNQGQMCAEAAETYWKIIKG